MRAQGPDTPAEREMMSRLLALAEVRADVPADRERRVKDAVLHEVRAVAHRRRVRRRVVAASATLAAAAAVVLGVRVGSPVEQAPPVPRVIGTIERLEGTVRRIASARDGATASIVSRSDALSVGDLFDTGGAGRLSVRFAQGASLRFDRGSRARLISSRRIELESGAVYFDDERDVAGLEIQTRHGLVKDIGTQFEARLADDSLRVRVRSGVVEVHENGEAVSAHAGTQLTVGPSGRSTKSVLPYGPEWDWVTALRAPYETNGRPLAGFLRAFEPRARLDARLFQ